MEYTQVEDSVIVKKLNSFDIAQILECGQCFRFHKVSDLHYTIIANNKILYIKQENDVISLYPCTIQDFESIWIKYFDLNRNYDDIKEEISKDDVILKEAIDFAPGIRLLNQEPYECLISFIISQNNRIPQIKNVIENMSNKFGEKINDPYGSNFNSFPTCDILNLADISDITLCKTGFRAKYIKDACKKISSNEIFLDELLDLNEEDCKKRLITIYGVGEKVADCVMLFSLEKYSGFPTDVWVKRVMEELYFEGTKTPIKQIHAFANNRWGKYSGFAQQYLFNYAKEKKIGKN